MDWISDITGSVELCDGGGHFDFPSLTSLPATSTRSALTSQPLISLCPRALKLAMASRSNIQAFLAGSVLTASLIYLYQKAQSSSSDSSTRNDDRCSRDVNPSSKRNTADNSFQLMDSASLDRRMIRKAEGAIRNRTSSLVIVVERCTNDHNYVSSTCDHCSMCTAL